MGKDKDYLPENLPKLLIENGILTKIEKLYLLS